MNVIAAFVIVTVHSFAPQFSLRPTKLPLSPGFESLLKPSIPNQLLIANGQSSGIVVPGEFSVYTMGSDLNGFPIGAVKAEYSGAWTFRVEHPIWRFKGRFRVQNPLKAFKNASILAVRGRSQILGIAYDEKVPNMDGPTDSRHGYLVKDGKVTDLGPAEEVKFRNDGSIEGIYVGNRSGAPYNVTIIGESFRHRFLWKHGKRSKIGIPTLITSQPNNK
jgi:hypothetical protein